MARSKFPPCAFVVIMGSMVFLAFLVIVQRNSTDAFFNSGLVSQAKMVANPPAQETYYFVLDNRFSILTAKAVQTQATLGTSSKD